MSSHPTKNVRARFAAIVSRDDDAIDLAEAALLIAAEEYPRLDVQSYLEKLDHFGDLAREEAIGSNDTVDLISALNSTLFDRLGFRGNTDSYYDARNSFLNDVMDRRLGIPITLTVVYIDVIQKTVTRIVV